MDHITRAVPQGALPRSPTPPSTLESWIALEVLLPQAIDDSDEAKFITLSEKLPWESGRPPPKGEQPHYQVSLGEIRLSQAYAQIAAAFVDENVPEAQGHAKLAFLGIVGCDQNGVPQSDCIAVSSFGWAVPLVLEKRLRHLARWSTEEPELIRALAPRLCRKSADGTPLPLDLRTLADVHAWLRGRLRLAPELVAPPSMVRSVKAPWSEAAELPLLNSFFLSDLLGARDLAHDSHAPAALRRYLEGSVDSPVQEDVLTSPGTLRELLAPAVTPCARWPSRSGSPLVTLQQAAVNAAISSEPGSITAVNGPPGTGKTTLLRDIVAANIAARAEVLMQFDNPAAAFTPTSVAFNVFGVKHTLHSVDKRLRGFEMIVASSNNAAVENVTRELPRLDAVTESGPSPRYFPAIASAVSGEACWGLVAAVLGNQQKFQAFRQSFWGDADTSMRRYLGAMANPTGTSAAQSAGLARESPAAGPQQALAAWNEERRRFKAAIAKTQGLMLQLQQVYKLETAARAHGDTLMALEPQMPSLAEQLRQHKKALSRAEARRGQAQQACDEAEARLLRHSDDRPSFIARLFRTRKEKAWRQYEASWRADLGDAKAKVEESEAQCERRGGRVTRAKEAVETLAAEIEKTKRLIAETEKALTRVDGDLRSRSAWRLEALPHADRQLATAWYDGAAQLARDAVFVAAMNLHRAFIDAAAGPLRQNLAAFFRQQWLRIPGAGADDVRDLWSSLSLVVPVVSTTFASVRRMFRDLEPASLGWLLLDESGQAAPQAAVGAIMRANRVVVVGDPLQVPPVVTLPSSITHAICAEFGVTSTELAAPDASVQTLADRSCRFSGRYTTVDGTRRVGIPLLVHRRCSEPMFSISNQVAYGNLMVSATPPRESAIGRVLGESRWIHVSGTASGRHWCDAEGDVLRQLLLQLAQARARPDLYVVSPFRSVSERAKHMVKNDARLNSFLGLPKARIGTVHTVQGREAEAVFLLLGAPGPHQERARAWAGDPPNLLNVAVTRAKERLYVIGNHQLWKSAGAFRHLASLLPVVVSSVSPPCPNP